MSRRTNTGLSALHMHGSEYRLDSGQLHGIPLMLTRYIEDEGTALHSHSFYEIAFVKKGTCRHQFAGRSFSIYAGDCFCILPGERHAYSRPDHCEIINIIFEGTLLEDLPRYLRNVAGFRNFITIEPVFRSETSFGQRLHLDARQQQMLVDLCEALATELDGRQPCFQLSSIGLFYQLIALISRSFEQNLDGRDGASDFDRKNDVIKAAISRLETGYAGDVTIEALAQDVFISPSRLQHLFKERTGMSIINHLNRIRIEQASALLVRPGASVSRIAADVGFHSPAYFSSLFKKLTGKSPRDFQK
jgi:AraC-like DNA-binding protein/mannose-6-phosphate isomerase-like protein (cupin superfamily)